MLRPAISAGAETRDRTENEGTVLLGRIDTNLSIVHGALVVESTIIETDR